MNPVMWTSIHQLKVARLEKQCSRWLVYTNFAWVLISLFLFFGWMGSNPPNISALNQQIKEYKVRDEIFHILRAKGMSLSQGIDIANSLILHARENKIPLEVGLGIMKKESEFHVNAISNKGAKGLMQLMDSTFDNYNKNLSMGLERQASFDPIINIRISMLHLKDLYGELKADWPKILNAYSGGAKNYARDVMKSSEEYKEKLR